MEKGADSFYKRLIQLVYSATIFQQQGVDWRARRAGELPVTEPTPACRCIRMIARLPAPPLHNIARPAPLCCQQRTCEAARERGRRAPAAQLHQRWGSAERPVASPGEQDAGTLHSQHGPYAPAAPEAAAMPSPSSLTSPVNLLQLPGFASAQQMRDEWWHGSLRPHCEHEWRALAAGEPLPQPQQLLKQLDALLLQLQQAAALAQLLLRQHADPGWRAAAAAVFTAARQLEQSICRCDDLYARLVAAGPLLAADAAASAAQQPPSLAHGAADPASSEAVDVGVAPARLHHLHAQLLRHFQLEGHHPRVGLGFSD